MNNQMDIMINKYLEKQCFAGASIFITHNGIDIYKKSFGYAVLTDNEKISLENDFIFDIASLTKIFTTTAIIRLVTLGELNLYNKITDILDFRKEYLTNVLKNITIHSLLTHTSGLIAWYPLYTRKNDNFEDILQYVLERNPIKEKVEYSDLNFIILGKIIEKVCKTSISKGMKKLVFEPLGLKNTSYAKAYNKVVATEYGNQIETKMLRERGLSFDSFRSAKKPIVGEVNDGNCYYYFNGESGHAGIFSDLDDLNTLCNVYQNNGKINGKEFIEPNLIKESITEYKENRGLGFQLGELYPSGFGHTGFTGTSIYINLHKKLNTIILTNRLHVKNPINISDFRKEIHEYINNNF